MPYPCLQFMHLDFSTYVSNFILNCYQFAILLQIISPYYFAMLLPLMKCLPNYQPQGPPPPPHYIKKIMLQAQVFLQK